MQNQEIEKQEIDTFRKQAIIFMIQQLTKDPQFLFNVSMGIKHFFQEFGKGGIKIGILHLEYRKELNGDDENCGYFKNTWFDSFEDASEKAKEIQKNKVYNEEKLFHFHQSYIQDIYNPPKRLYS